VNLATFSTARCTGDNSTSRLLSTQDNTAPAFTPTNLSKSDPCFRAIQEHSPETSQTR